MSWMWHFGEILGRDSRLALKSSLLLSSAPTLTFTDSRHFNLPKKCLICFTSSEEAQAPSLDMSIDNIPLPPPLYALPECKRMHLHTYL